MPKERLNEVLTRVKHFMHRLAQRFKKHSILHFKRTQKVLLKAIQILLVRACASWRWYQRCSVFEIAGAVTAFWIALVLWLVGGVSAILTLAANPNNLGDFFAGAFAPLAFAWLVIAVLLQNRALAVQQSELKQNNKALVLQAEELRRTVDEMAKQTALLDKTLRFQKFLEAEDYFENEMKIVLAIVCDHGANVRMSLYPIDRSARNMPIREVLAWPLLDKWHTCLMEGNLVSAVEGLHSDLKETKNDIDKSATEYSPVWHPSPEVETGMTRMAQLIDRISENKFRENSFGDLIRAAEDLLRCWSKFQILCEGRLFKPRNSTDNAHSDAKISDGEMQ